MFRAEIIDASKELSTKEKVMLKDTTGAIKLDDATKEGDVIINPVMYAVLKIENDKSDNPEYYNYIIVDADGTKYVTGSTSFWNSFTDIISEMSGSGEEYSIRVYRRPSKKYTDKEFITCSII